ncbi:hypothetical protein J5U23_03178 [Saccharolobus shibatae B12]|uniref:Uncharacterized protein F-92 n=2 Tax=root TaxID=1 RepID=F92_SSV1|nr:hypothetical protein [Saccharolobus shibatae]NP_039780.1 ORF F-92 [Sulfolobus spindle-shaped virus 1]P20221.1 RecName: Full=Uncharacterized protein F-92 [Sulfolobus spindle-shaped virus 1]QXJ30281.1 hypothetical protein J5U23_03178 [Saccharolobus shibatae B12]CAA30213.1 ORF F-92 [Sulfolobus spindle-shaped virus 1]
MIFNSEELIIISDLGIVWVVSIIINDAKGKLEKKLEERLKELEKLEELEKELEKIENELRLMRGVPLDLTDIKGKLDELKAEIAWLEYKVDK